MKRIEKFIKQTGVCIILLLSLMVLKDLDIRPVNAGIDFCTRQIAKSYQLSDLKGAGEKAVETFLEAKSVVASTIISTGETRYGEPIDELRSGEVSAVYAVSGGTVVASGEDKTLGRYIKIDHGNDTESVYGQCSDVYVRPLERVKKGQIIAEYNNENAEDFYFVLSHLK